MRVNSQSKSGWISAMPVVFVLIWSTGFIVARYGMPLAPPMKFLMFRFLFSILCFLPWIWIAKIQWPQGIGQWRHLAITGVLMQACYLGGVWCAIKLGMGSGLSSLIVGLQPVLTAFWLAGAGVAVTGRQWSGLLLGLAGLFMVVSRKFGVDGEATWLNLGSVLVALVGITVGTLYQKRFVAPCDVRTASVVQLGAAFVVSVPLALLETEAMQWNSQLMGAMAWSVLALTLGGSSLLFMLIQRGAAASVTSLLYLVPPVTALMAWFLFDESITLMTMVGTLVTAGGVGLVVSEAKK